MTLDLWLHGQTGESLVQAYRGLPNATAALVLLSAAPEVELAAARTGAVRYLTRLFELEDLLRVLAELLGAR